MKKSHRYCLQGLRPRNRFQLGLKRGILWPVLMAWAFFLFPSLHVPVASAVEGVRLVTTAPFPDKLSAWNIFVRQDNGPLRLNEGVLPYDLNTTLFTDYASKLRTLWLPPGKKVEYRGEGVLHFPQGAILTKTFFYSKSSLQMPAAEVDIHEATHEIQVQGDLAPLKGQHLLETRLLVNTASGWVALPYVWNDQQTEAYLRPEGQNIAVVWNHPQEGDVSFNYKVPNQITCKRCHNSQGGIAPLGPKAGNLNKDTLYFQEGLKNQLSHWSEKGLLQDLPDLLQVPRFPVWDDPSTGPLEERVLTYLEVNCHHCHRPEGQAGHLLLGRGNWEPTSRGICKKPLAPFGQRPHVISPGQPQNSTLIYRISSTRRGEMMPPVGRGLVDAKAVHLIEQWISQLSDRCH